MVFSEAKLPNFNTKRRKSFGIVTDNGRYAIAPAFTIMIQVP